MQAVLDVHSCTRSVLLFANEIQHNPTSYAIQIVEQ
jgi:hypothetical protein